MHVWLIDDRLTLAQARDLLGLESEELTVSSPDGDSFALALDGARDDAFDLILVDEELWEEQAPPHAVDGASLVATIRAWARMHGLTLPGVVILTSQPESFRNEVPAVGAWRPLSTSFVDHEAFIGRTLDVEWLLTKSDPNLPAKIADLAGSFIKARDDFHGGGISFDELAAYLPLPDTAWKKAAETALRLARPPITEEVAFGQHPQRGPATVLIWLLQRALAFPGLFLSDYYAATALDIVPDALDRALEGQCAAQLKEALYSGPLHTVVARRWWSAGLDRLVADAEQEETPVWQKLGLEDADRLNVEDPVVILGRSLVEEEIAPLAEAVRVQPQGWPAEALQPWMRRTDAGSPEWVRGLVDPVDASRSEK